MLSSLYTVGFLTVATAIYYDSFQSSQGVSVTVVDLANVEPNKVARHLKDD